MKRFGYGLLVILLVGAGCQRPGPVELQTDTPSPTIEVSNVTIDTSTTISSIDTTALLPTDEANFLGRFLLNTVTYDAGQAFQRTESFTSAELTIDRPFASTVNEDRDHGYYGIPLGKVFLNDSLLSAIPHYFTYKTALGGERQVPFGFEYRRSFNTTTVPTPNTLNRWHAQPDSVSSFDITVNMPDKIVVVSPAGGADVPRDKDLIMRWTGKGDLSIVISTIDLRGNTRPVMKVQPKSNTGAAILPSKILRLLPREQNFVFTFVVANRNESITIGRYPGRVLAQAASIYNSYVKLH